MEQSRPNNLAATNQQPSQWAKLLRKLRWIGADEEASRVEQVMKNLPPEERGTVAAEPSGTD